MGTVRLQTPPLAIINPRPRDGPPDLRLENPFPALQQLATTIPWDTLENHQHSHVPYPLILLRLAQKWKDSHNGKLPQTFPEKQEFQQTVKAASRNFDNELNFQEAQKNAYLAYAERKLDLDHLATLRDACASSCESLHVLLQALDIFLKNHANQPPLQGTIPDMTASTDLYIQLQRAYREQADQDLKEMRALVPVTITDEQVATFCQNVFVLDLVKTRTIQDEYHGAVPDDLAEDLAMATMEGEERPDQTALLWYLGLAGCRIFHDRNGRYPGVLDDFEQDVAPLQECIVEIVKKYKLQDNDLVKDTLLKTNNYAQELARYGNAEIHNIASVVGGVAGQEAVKIITGQYVIIDNTYVYNGIASIGGVYRV
jgi:amyloid beta precursor protein binding protein 1